jgi:hypothetical protein
MANTEEITILLKARDKELQSVILKNTRLISKFSREAKADTGKATQAVETNMTRMKASFSSFGRGALAGLGAAAIVAGLAKVSGAVARTVTDIASMGDEARRSGVNLAAFQEWKFVAEQNRIGIDQMVDGLKELNLRADEFVVTGSGPAAEAFNRLGMGADDLKDRLKDPSELMLELIGRMGDLDTAAQIRVSDELFGGSAGERFVELLGQGEAGLRDTIATAHEVGAVLDAELVERADELSRKFGEIQSRVSASFQSLVVGGASVLDNLVAQKTALEDIISLREESRYFPENPIPDDVRMAPTGEDLAAVAAIRDGYDAVFQAARSLSIELETMPRQLLAEGAEEDAYLISAIAQELDALTKQWDAQTISAEDFGAELSDLIVDADGAVASLDAIDGVDLDAVGARVVALRVLVAGLAMAARNAVESFNPQVTMGPSITPDQLAGMRQASLDESGVPQNIPRPAARPLDPDFGMPPLPKASAKTGGGSGGAAKTVADPFGDAMAATADEITALEMEAAALLAVAGAGMEYGAAVEYARTRAELLYEAQQAGKELTPAMRAEIDALSLAYVTAGQSADEAAESLQKIEADAARGGDALTDMFMSIADGSKSAVQAIGGLLLEMAKVAAQQAILGAVSGTSAAGFVGSMLGGARAKGGPAGAGVPYLVNEGTPNSEIFVPSTSGAVLNVPQAQAALRDSSGGSGSSGNGVLNVSVSVSGARGNAEINAMVQQGVESGIASFDRNILPQRVGAINRDPRKVS